MTARDQKITSFILSFKTTLLAAYVMVSTATVHAAPGTLSDSPMFLTNPVQPNIALMLDDSGSMGWETLLNKGTYNPGDVVFTGALRHPPGSFTGNGATGTAPDDLTDRRLTCHGFNLMAYNPKFTYTPWLGNDDASNPFGNMTLTTARSNPYAASSTTDISNHIYFTWTDGDGDGAYDGPGSISAGEPANAATDECGDVSSNSGGTAVNSLPLTAVGNNPNSQENYANWWTYYRSRDFIAKRALSETITNSTVRMGLATINNSAGMTAVKDINDKTTPVNATAAANKATLLDNLFQVSPSGSTPLRQGLEAVGEYFEDNLSGTWGASPILSSAQGGECQQNFALLMSDGYWNGSDPSATVGNADTDDNTVFDGDSFADGAANISLTLADVAMHYYERDLDNVLANNVPATTTDPTGLPNNKMHQHMKTFAVAFGLNGQLNSNPADPTVAFDATNGGPWPVPVANTLTTVDDMRHAAWNGRGRFLSANNPLQLINILNSSFGTIAGLTSSGASVALNTSSLSANSRVYLALLDSNRWSGELLSFALNGVTGAINSTEVWSSAVVLDNRNLSASPRTILTFDGSDGIPFQWASLAAAQKDDLRVNPSGGVDSDAAAVARLAYLRGERSCEQGNAGVCSHTVGASTFSTRSLRTRDSRLGDFVHSAPVYVGAPEVNWPDNLAGTTPYSNFRLAQQNRAGVIYVGGNDGMLHGFAESDGSEVLAYVPSTLYSTVVNSGLHYLTDPAYTHRYYVDLRPSITDAYIKVTAAGSADWRTILVGGLRGGGRGLFALNITTPVFSETGTAPADTVLWEFDSTVDADLGYTFSQPSIVLTNSGKWAAIFGNGYNDSGTGEAQLFIVDIEGGLDGTWTLGTDYQKITTGAGTTLARNGLATPAVVDLDGNGTADRVYAGDLEGNMWAFDISSTNAGQWDVDYKNGNTPAPLFTTQSNQPVTVTPVVVRNSAIASGGNNQPNLLVIFGTGQYLTSSDVTSTTGQSFYGVWDSGNDSLDITDLVQQTISTGTTNGVTGRKLTDNTVDYANGDDGWYMNLPDTGERQITDAVIRGDLVYFNTSIPDNAPCSNGGTGWLMLAKIMNGGRPNVVSFDLNGNGVFDLFDVVGGENAVGVKVTGLPSSPVNLGNKRYTSTTDSVDGSTIVVDEIIDISGTDSGRLSWEELKL
jgi:type IV pilus assembly protein PilY1